MPAKVITVKRKRKIKNNGGGVEVLEDDSGNELIDDDDDDVVQVQTSQSRRKNSATISLDSPPAKASDSGASPEAAGQDVVSIEGTPGATGTNNSSTVEEKLNIQKRDKITKFSSKRT